MDDYDRLVQEKLDDAMPLVGLYIAAGSAVCTLAMAADALNGFRLQKLWFPCKYFSLNAASLTLLAEAMKLPMDLNTNMLISADWYSKFSSLIFMSIALANFMCSLGPMSTEEILANVVALGILVIMVSANIWIQLIQLRHVLVPVYLTELLAPTIWMLLLLAMVASSAITVPTIKRSLESKYQEKHKEALREEEVSRRREAFRIDDQRRHMMKYLVMAETSTPQFVMARSVVCTTSTAIGLLAFTLLWAYLRVFLEIGGVSLGHSRSVYGGYTRWIVLIQSTGAILGLMAPVLRCSVAVSFKCSTTNWNNFKKGLKIEAHWIQTLVDWRDSFSALQIQPKRWRKYLHDIKWFAITFCMGVQILIVSISKLLIFLFALCFTCIKKFLQQCSFNVVISNNQIEHKFGDDDAHLNLSRYVLLLEGEAELPRRFLKNICTEADNMIQTGRKKQPESLLNHLHKFVSFYGVGQFDSNQIPSLHSQEPPNCWMLPVITLTSIAIALPNSAKRQGKQLLSSMSEGLSLAKIAEKTLDKNAQLVNIRKAADVTWVGVVLYMKWLDIDLRRTSQKCKNSTALLQDLCHKAKMIVMEFKKVVKDSLMENPLNWPAKVVAANSMYRISRTILLSCDDGENHEQMDDKLFDQLSIMIADILAACLTNLPHAITTMCHHNAIEKREKSVHKAFLLLGKTEKVVEFLQEQEWPSLDHDKAANIEEWRSFFQQDKDDPTALTLASTSDDEIMFGTPASSEEHLAITLDC